MGAEKMWQKLHHVYPPEIIQASMLSRLQKKPLEHNDCFCVASALQQRVSRPPADNIPSLQNYFQINCQSVIPMLLRCIGTILGQFAICLNVILRTWDMFLHNGLTQLHVSFMTRSAAFFSSNASVTSRLQFFLIRKQSS